MSFVTFKLPQFPQYTVFYTFFKDVPNSTLSEVKKQVISGNKEYDFCFLNIQYLISLQLLRQSAYRSLQNFENGTMKANTLNAEIIFNLSPVNNIVDALKRFGLDDTASLVLVVSVVKDSDVKSDTFAELNSSLLQKLNLEPENNVELSDDYLYKQLNVAKFKKTFKLNDAVLPTDETELRARLTALAIGTCVTRGV